MKVRYDCATGGNKKRFLCWLRGYHECYYPIDGVPLAICYDCEAKRDNRVNFLNTTRSNIIKQLLSISWKLRFHCIKLFLQKIYYRLFYNIKLGGLDGTLHPSFGKGKFVDVIKKGDFIDIISHTNYQGTQQGTIRIIPCQYNHGVMIEFIDQNNKMRWRTYMDYVQFYSKGFSIGKKQ